MGPGRGDHIEVGLERPGVPVEIGGVAELGRIHEDGHGHHVALAGRFDDE